jgi:hypothetical protein
MSKHLLRKLLNLQSDKTSDNLTNISSDKKSKEKYVQYYSTDKARQVVAKVPNKMSIIHNKQPSEQTITSHYSTYNDDLSDVSTTLLRKVLNTNKKLKPLTYYSTDKDSYVQSLGSSKLNIIKDISELSSEPSSQLSSEPSSQVSSINTYSNNNKYPNYQYFDNQYPQYSNDLSSIYSSNFSDKSSYNSNTSYDSFYDNNDKQQHFSKLIEKYDLKDILDLDEKKSDSTFNIFKQNHK